jgi:hypothetical protein
LNSDNSVNGGDFPLFSGNFNRSLPNAEPGSLSFPPPASLAPPDEEDLYISLIDDYFTQFDKEEETLLLFTHSSNE